VPRTGIVCVDPRISVSNVLNSLMNAFSRMRFDSVEELRGGRRWARAVLKLGDSSVVIEALADRGVLAVSTSSDTLDHVELSLLAREVSRLLLGTHRCRRLQTLPLA